VFIGRPNHSVEKLLLQKQENFVRNPYRYNRGVYDVLDQPKNNSRTSEKQVARASEVYKEHSRSIPRGGGRNRGDEMARTEPVGKEKGTLAGDSGP